MRHVRGRGEVHTAFWWGNLRESDNVEELCFNGRIILKGVLMKWFSNALNGLIWPKIETRGRVL